jgi:hypothetical protein
MAARQGRSLEILVAQLEHLFGKGTLTVQSPEHIRSLRTADMVEVDVTLRGKLGSSEVLIALECRDRGKKQGVNWIRELATKKNDIGASAIVAVSSAGFTSDAKAEARSHGVQLRTLSRLTSTEIASAVLGVDIWIAKGRYVLTGVPRVKCRGFTADWGRQPPQLTSDKLRELLENPTEPLLYDEKRQESVSFRDVLERVDWASALRSPPPVVVDAVFTYANEYGCEAERYRWFFDQDTGVVLTELRLVADVAFGEHERVELSEVLEYSQQDRCMARVANIDLAPYGRPGEVLRVAAELDE